MISGSRIHRVVACPASETLPHVLQSIDHPAAERGRVIHRFLERAPVIGADAALIEAAAEFRPYLSAIDLDSLPTGLAAEVSFAWDWREHRGREIGRNLDRRYDLADPPLSATEIPLTLDLVGVDPSRRWVYVRDYKTGHVRLPRPGVYGQTLLGGLAAASAYGCDSATLELTYLDSDGDTWTTGDNVDGWDLETYGDRIEAAMIEIAAIRVRDGILNVTEGDHCEYCPAFKSCPAKTALVRAFPGMVEAVGAPGYLAPDRLADTWRKIQLLREILGRVEGEIFALAAFEPVDLGDGMVLGTVTTEREKYQGEVAAAVLAERYGAEAAREASVISISKERLREAVAKRRKPGEKLQTKAGDGLLDQVDAAIRARNGVDWSRTTKVGAHRPRSRRLPGL